MRFYRFYRLTPARRAAFALFGVVASFFVSAANLFAADLPTPFADALRPFVESGDAIPGAVVVVASPTEILSVETVGWADVESKRPMRDDAFFWIASQSKAIVAAAAICVDEGKLDLDVPVETYLPELKELKVAYPQEDGSIVLRAPKTKPTLRQALSHTAGLRFLTPFQESFGIDSLPVRRLMKVVASTPLIADPGERYSYSNLGIDVAQAAVEAVSGVPFEEFLQRRIFDPLGMTDTTFYPSEEQKKRLATPYAWDADAKKMKPIRFNQTPSLDDGSPRYAEGGGGLFSSAKDVVKFYQTLGAKGVAPDGTRILSEKAVEEASTKQTGDAIADRYGFGLAVDDRTFGHGGAYGTHGVVYRDGSVVAVYMVAVAGLPRQGEAENAFRKTLDEIATKRSAARSER